MLFQTFVVVEFSLFGRLAAEDQAQVAQHQIGAYDARFPEVGAAGRGLAAVVVEDHAVADGRDAGEFRVLGRQFRKGVARAYVEPDVGRAGQQIGLFEVYGDGGVRVVLRVDVFTPGVLDQADHETARRRHEPSVAIRGVEHHFGADGGCGTGDGGFDGSVTFGDAAEGFGAPVAVVAEFGGDHQPFGFAQRRFFHVVAYIYIGYAQFAEFARDDGVFARDAVQQHQVGLHGGEPLEVEVRVVAHVEDLAAAAVFVDIGVGNVVDSGDAADATYLTDGVEHGYVARRHADHMAYGGFHDLAVETGGRFDALAQNEQMLFDAATALPRGADGDERRRIAFRAADVESRSVCRGIDFGREIGRSVARGASAGGAEKRQQERYEGLESFHRGQN